MAHYRLQEGATPVSPLPASPIYITDQNLEASGFSPGQSGSMLADANQVFLMINSSMWVTQSAAVTWAATTWGTASQPVNRLNAAIGLLINLGLVYQIGT